MRILGFYGKGGIGKSTVVTNLSVLYSRNGNSVLQFGCDPKSDSCYSLVQGDIVTVMDQWVELGDSELNLENCLMRTPYKVDAIEVGGPMPGTGCGGRGITKALELIGEPGELHAKYDVILFDVLGDVVCGGFSAPMREGYATEIYIVSSGEFRSLYAANNLCHAVKKHSRNQVRLGGIIGNLRGLPNEEENINKFAETIRSQVIHIIPKDFKVTQAEIKRMPLVEFDRTCDAAREYDELYNKINNVAPGDLTIPKPLTNYDFDRLFLTPEPL